MSFQFYTATEKHLEKYYQLPKVFFEDSLYKSMSNDSKIAYSILKDRFNYSIKNNWIDSDDRIYFIFTNNELVDILNVSSNTVIKIKKELQSVNLLYQEKQGLNKANHLYLGKPQINASNSYQKSASSLGNKGSAKFALPEKSASSLGNKGSAKFALPEKSTSSLDTKGSANFAPNLYLTNLDTSLDTFLDTGKPLENLEKYAQQLESEIDNPIAGGIPNQAQQTLLTFAQNDYKIVEQQIGMIFRAKKEVAKQEATSLVIEYFENDFINQVKILSLAIYKDKKSLHKIRDYNAYFYTSFVKYFEEQVNKERQLADTTEFPKVPMSE